MSNIIESLVVTAAFIMSIAALYVRYKKDRMEKEDQVEGQLTFEDLLKE